MTTTDTPTAGAQAQPADDKYMQYGKTGGPARMAVLQYLAQHPRGATFEMLCAVVHKAVGHYVVDRRVLQVLMGMRADNLLAREASTAGAGRPQIWRWFSPASRQAGIARGTWRPDLGRAEPEPDPNTDDATAQAAGAAAIAQARGLATDPLAD